MIQCESETKALPTAYQAGVLLGEDLKTKLGVDNCPVIQSASDIQFAFGALAELEREVMIAGTLDCKCRLVFWNLISVGSSDKLVVRTGEAFTGAIRCQASAIFLAHNHPSGSLEPSRADLQTTEEVAKAGLLLGYPLLDHVIIARAGIRSLMTVQCLKAASRGRRKGISIVQCEENCNEHLQWICSACKQSNEFNPLFSMSTSQQCTYMRCAECNRGAWLYR